MSEFPQITKWLYNVIKLETGTKGVDWEVGIFIVMRIGNIRIDVKLKKNIASDDISDKFVIVAIPPETYEET